jgi:hypothetical protein
VREGVRDEVGDVLIGQPINDVLALAAAGDKAFVAENAEALGDGGDLFVFRRRHFGDAELATGEEGEKAEAGRVAERAKDAGGASESLVGNVEGGGGAGVLVEDAFGSEGCWHGEMAEAWHAHSFEQLFK